MQLEVKSPAPHKDLVGVGGWLLFLCISLTIASPLWQAHLALKILPGLISTEHVDLNTLFRRVILFVTYSALSGFSCAAGIMLWSENPKGPTVARAYLITSVVSVISIYSVCMLLGADLNLMKVAFQRLVYACTWYSYLVASTRVRLTYAALR